MKWIRAEGAEENSLYGSEEQYQRLKPLALKFVYIVAERKRAKENK